MTQLQIKDVPPAADHLAAPIRYADSLAHLFAQEQGLYPIVLAPHTGGPFLDLSCGTGWWSHQIANAFPSCSVVGVDRDAALIAHARHTVQANITFVLLETPGQLLPFASASFDFLHLGFVSHRIQANEWKGLLGECVRLLRPGGVVSLEDRDFSALSRSRAFTDYNDLLIQAMRRAGHLLQKDAGDRVLGPVDLLSSWLQQAGFQHIQGEQIMVPFGAGARAHQACCDVLTTEMDLFRPLLMQASDTTAEEIRQLERQAQDALQEPTFEGILCFQQVWACKQPCEPEHVALSGTAEVVA